MVDLQLPARHDWAIQERNYGKLVIEPFEPSLALTVGIAYRRALLSGIHGAAPVWAKIEHVLHEFSKSLDEIKTVLGAMDLSLGMHLDPDTLERLRAESERAEEA